MTSPFRALVVEDEPISREATILALQDGGFSCEWARDGAEAVGALAGSSFDVVVTDLRMPNRHGFWLAGQLLQKSARPAIVVLTGVDEPRMAHDLLRRGVDDYLVKPVGYDMLIGKLKGVIERRRVQLCRNEMKSVCQPPATARES